MKKPKNDTAEGQTIFVDPEEVVIVLDPSHPAYDERAADPIDKEMVADVLELGVHTPPTLKHYVDDKGKRYKAVVVGRRRFKASLVANRQRVAEGLEPRKVECKLRDDLTDEEVRAYIVSENEHRRQDSLKNRIDKAHRMYRTAEAEAEQAGERFDAKAMCAKLAVHFGTTALTIRRWVEVPKLGAAARGAIYRGEVPLGSVDSLKNMSSAVQAETVKEIASSGAVGTKGARKVAEEKPQAKPDKGPPQPRRSRKAIEAKIAEWIEKGEGRDVAAETRIIAEATVRALRYALGGDTL